MFKILIDINKLLEGRRKKKKEQLKALCTHTRLDITAENDVAYQSLFVSPSLTIAWICQRCGMTVMTEEQAKLLAAEWARDPIAWVKREKAFFKAYKKVYR